MDAQRESRDADIFRRVVDRIKLCVEEATSPTTAAASSVPESSISVDRGNKKRGKVTEAEASGVGAGGAAGAQCNWALAHAACRVCRVVGRTFQVAIRWVWESRSADFFLLIAFGAFC